MKRDSETKTSFSKIWFGLVLIVLCVYLCCLVYKIFSIQIIHGEEYLEQAERSQYSSSKRTGVRGEIVDCNGTILANSIPVYSVAVNSHAIDNIVANSKVLASVLDMDDSEVYEIIANIKKFAWVKRHVDEETADAIRDLLKSKKLVGVELRQESKRNYPNGKLASQLIGFVDIDGNGVDGMELSFDNQLKPKTEYDRVHRIGGGKMISESGSKLVEDDLNGQKFELTIDLNIQHVAENALNRAVDEFAALGGTVIAVDVKTGHILALANAPSFDPNDRKGSPASRRNRAVTDQFEPGSVFKTFVTAAYMQKFPNYDPDKILLTKGLPIPIGRYSVKEHDGIVHDNLSLIKILQKSSNVGAATLAFDVGKKDYYNFLKQLGFGEKTNIGLVGEIKGLLHPWEKWADIQLATISFGQGVTVTSLQLAMAYTAIANNGYYNYPSFYKGQVTPEGRQVLSPKDAKVLQKMLSSVVERGTGKAALLEHYTSGGKTGTAQKAEKGGYSNENYFAVFAGFAPLEDPRVVVVVNVDQPSGKRHQGGVVAAPVFKEVAEAALITMAVPPSLGYKKDKVISAKNKNKIILQDGPVESIDSDNPKASSKAVVKGTLPSFKGLSIGEALQKLSKLNLPSAGVKVKGSGFVNSQDPESGTPLKDVDFIELNCAPMAK